MVSKVRNVNRLGVFSGGGCHHPNHNNFLFIARSTLYLVCLKMIVTCYLLMKAKVLWKNQGLYGNFWTILSQDRPSLSVSTVI